MTEARNDGRFNVQTIAKLLMIDERRIQQLVKEGWIPRGERGRYTLVESVQGYIKYLKEHGRETQRGTEHARLARAQAMRVEMDNFRRMGELQTTAQVEETTQGLVVMMKSSHAALPGRLANELASITEPPRIYKRLQEELRAVDNQCADFLEKRAATLEAMPEPGEDAPPIHAPDADGLGGGESGDAG
jgi:phage terminase Nu1 subunit (DNA packaging protein)